MKKKFSVSSFQFSALKSATDPSGRDGRAKGAELGRKEKCGFLPKAATEIGRLAGIGRFWVGLYRFVPLNFALYRLLPLGEKNVF